MGGERLLSPIKRMCSIQSTPLGQPNHLVKTTPYNLPVNQQHVEQNAVTSLLKQKMYTNETPQFNCVLPLERLQNKAKP